MHVDIVDIWKHEFDQAQRIVLAWSLAHSPSAQSAALAREQSALPEARQLGQSRVVHGYSSVGRCSAARGARPRGIFNMPRQFEAADLRGMRAGDSQGGSRDR